MLLLTFDDTGRKPKFKQIIDQIRRMIDTGALWPGEKLPSTRRLAEKIGIHRSTVSLAYQELWALGFIDLKPGACPRVRRRMDMVTAEETCGTGSIEWKHIASPQNDTVLKAYLQLKSRNDDENRKVIDFSTLNMDPRLFPLDSFKSSLNRALKTQGIELLSYGDRLGFLPLRRYIARHLQCHGISVTSDHILLTSGSQQAIDLALRMIAAPDKTIAIEAPSYNFMLPLLRFYGFKTIEVPLKPDGMDLNSLEGFFKGKKKEKPALVYTMPNLHNPTGISTSQAHREGLLRLCETHGVPILEDGFEEEMKYFGRVVLPVKSMDRNHIVIYCGTFSKVLFPGLRIGWVAADRECVQRMAAIRCFSEVSSSMLLQAAMYDFCRTGYYDRHISKMHRVFRKRMQTAIRHLRKNISFDLAEWSEPTGGYLIWLKLKKPPRDHERLELLLASQNIKLLHGRYCFYSETPEIYVRLSISYLNEEEIQEGIGRFKKVLEISAKDSLS